MSTALARTQDTRNAHRRTSTSSAHRRKAVSRPLHTARTSAATSDVCSASPRRESSTQCKHKRHRLATMYLVSCGKTAYMHLAAAARVIDCSHLISMSLLHQFQGPANAHGADEARVVMRKKAVGTQDDTSTTCKAPGATHCGRYCGPILAPDPCAPLRPTARPATSE